MKKNKLINNRGISIVTIVLNQKDLIEKTIKSVIEQKDINLEYIIIDGGSTDGTQDVIELYRNHIAHFISEPDGGIYQAINKGVSLATEPLVGLIHCGDFYKKDILKIVFDKFINTNADVIYGNIEIVEEVGDKVINHFPIANHKTLDKKMSVFHPSSFISLSAYKKFGLYDTSYKSAADYDLLLKLFLNGCSFTYLSNVLAVFNAEGLSSKNFKLSLKENIRIRTKYFSKWNGFKYSLKNTTIHFVFSIRKKVIQFIIGENNFNKIKQLKHRK
jgi:glycosyltransferase involved in cell wall biosynthesis